METPRDAHAAPAFGEGVRLAGEKDPAMWQRHEYLSGSTKVDRDWWIVAKLVALTAVCALISAGVFGLL